MKTQFIKTIIGLFLLSLIAFNAACSFGNATAAQAPPRVKPLESPTPGYKQVKRVSRDIIKSDTKEESTQVKTKVVPVKVKTKQ